MKALQPKTRDAVLAIAAWQIGVMESPSGSNKVKYGQEYGLNGQPWCLMFIWWVFKEAGFSLYKTASCTALMNQYKQNAPKQWVTSGFKPGDIVLFDFTGKKAKTEHCGIVESVDADGNLVTIEGNTGTGNDANGGAVMRRSRNIKYVTGAVRPGYNL
jgi:hypothetical protein